MNPVGPIYTAELFLRLHTGLMAVLRDLSADDWTRSTACSPWTVKDVAAHMLDIQVRRLSFHRDGLPVPPAYQQRPRFDRLPGQHQRPVGQGLAAR